MAMPPQSFMFAQALSDFFRMWGVFLLPVFGALMWADGKVYALLHRRFGKATARLYFWAIVIILIAVVFWVMWAVESPRWRMGEVVGTNE